jgi:hypothetical protein
MTDRTSDGQLMPPATFLRRWLSAIEEIREADIELTRRIEETRRAHQAKVESIQELARHAANILGNLVPEPGDQIEFLAGPLHRQMVCRLARNDETGEVTIIGRLVEQDWNLEWPASTQAFEDWSEDDRIGIPGLDPEDVVAALNDSGCE